MKLVDMEGMQFVGPVFDDPLFGSAGGDGDRRSVPPVIGAENGSRFTLNDLELDLVRYAGTGIFRHGDNPTAIGVVLEQAAE